MIIYSSPEEVTAEDLRLFQLHLVNIGTTGQTINVTLTALRFLYNITLDRPEVVSKLSSVPVARKLPEVFSMDEAKQLIEAAMHPKFKAALTVAYGAGLRVSEVVNLKVSDVDSERMALRVEQGKCRRDRTPCYLLSYLTTYATGGALRINKGRCLKEVGYFLATTPFII